jgi:hypothetical protein
MNNKLYRDELVARIKDAGQELIDRAEQMVSENREEVLRGRRILLTDLISSFSIYLRLDTEDHIPSIEWSIEVINKNSYNRLNMKGE